MGTRHGSADERTVAQAAAENERLDAVLQRLLQRTGLTPSRLPEVLARAERHPVAGKNLCAARRHLDRILPAPPPPLRSVPAVALPRGLRA